MRKASNATDQQNEEKQMVISIGTEKLTRNAAEEGLGRGSASCGRTCPLSAFPSRSRDGGGADGTREGHSPAAEAPSRERSHHRLQITLPPPYPTRGGSRATVMDSRWERARHRGPQTGHGGKPETRGPPNQDTGGKP